MYSAVGKARLVSPEQKKKSEWNAGGKKSSVNSLPKARIATGLEIALEPLNQHNNETDLINTCEGLMEFD